MEHVRVENNHGNTNVGQSSRAPDQPGFLFYQAELLVGQKRTGFLPGRTENQAGLRTGWEHQGARLTAVTEMAGVVLRLVVHPHMICDVSSRQQLPTDVAGDLLLVADHVRT